MQIHELTQRPKKIDESLSSFFGFDNPTVAKAWSHLGGELVQDLAARFSKDPKYANMSVSQRKLALARDESIQQIADKKFEEWNKYVSSLQIKNGAPLTDQQYQAALLNWANQSLFNNKLSNLDTVAKSQAQFHLNWIAKHKNDPVEIKKMLAALISDETSRMVQVATDLKIAQQSVSNPQTNQPTTAGAASPEQAVAPAPKTGLPTARDTEIFNRLVAKALRAQA